MERGEYRRAVLLSDEDFVLIMAALGVMLRLDIITDSDKAEIGHLLERLEQEQGEGLQ